jgi:hypothetical protein
MNKVHVRRSRSQVSPSAHQIHKTPGSKQQRPPSPQPRGVQLSKRRQSAKGPVGDGADLVVAHVPAPANHCVSKRSRMNSPKLHPHRTDIA